MTEAPNSLTISPQNDKPDYKRYDAQVRAICYSMAKSFSRSGNLLVDDYIQIACVKVWQAFDRYDPSLPLAPFVRSIAKNAFIDINKSPQNMYMLPYTEAYQESVRKDGRFAPESESSEYEPVTLPFDRSCCSESCLSDVDVDALLSTLSEKERAVVESSYGINRLYEMPDDRIAEELNVSRQTVISVRKASLRKMKKGIGR